MQGHYGNLFHAVLVEIGIVLQCHRACKGGFVVAKGAGQIRESVQIFPLNLRGQRGLARQVNHRFGGIQIFGCFLQALQQAHPDGQSLLPGQRHAGNGQSMGGMQSRCQRQLACIGPLFEYTQGFPADTRCAEAQEMMKIGQSSLV